MNITQPLLKIRSWHFVLKYANTNYLLKKGFSRMRLLHKTAEFSVPKSDLVTIYIQYIRSLLDQSCQIWHSSLTQEDSESLERVQKTALKVILKEDYISYENALAVTDIDSLSERRDELCLRFAKKCTKSPKTADMFPLNPVISGRRPHEKYQVCTALTDRLRDSAIPYMQRLLNANC